MLFFIHEVAEKCPTHHDGMICPTSV